jgi:hypothetical protein
VVADASATSGAGGLLDTGAPIKLGPRNLERRLNVEAPRRWLH